MKILNYTTKNQIILQIFAQFAGGEFAIQVASDSILVCLSMKHFIYKILHSNDHGNRRKNYKNNTNDLDYNGKRMKINIFKHHSLKLLASDDGYIS